MKEQANSSAPRIIVALDFPDASEALTLVNKLDPELCRVKVGKELFTCAGPDVVKTLAGLGYDVFLDLKFHDIPNTVAAACHAAAELGAWMINVHALGGRRMLEAAAEAVRRHAHPPLLIAVTVLTSLNEQDCAELGLQGAIRDHVTRLGELAAACGLDGLVCSGQEVSTIREALGANLVLVTPGIRPMLATQDDQRRVMTPSQVRKLGADYLVIGRPITRAPDPNAVLSAIHQEIAEFE